MICDPLYKVTLFDVVDWISPLSITYSYAVAPETVFHLINSLDSSKERIGVSSSSLLESKISGRVYSFSNKLDGEETCSAKQFTLFPL